MQATSIRSLITIALLSAVGASLATPPAGRNWQLQWADEFNKKIDYTLWNNWHDNSWRNNNGHSVYLSAAKALSVNDSCALITVVKGGDTAYSSGLWTKAGYGPGYYEARVKSGRAWAGFWVQGIGGDCSSITSGCEFDIMENCCPGNIQHNIHWGGYGSCHAQAPHATGVSQDNFYVFGLWWSAQDGAKFYVDNKLTYTYAGATPNNTGTVILSVESEDVNTPFMIDYVRYYKDGGATSFAGTPRQTGHHRAVGHTIIEMHDNGMVIRNAFTGSGSRGDLYNIRGELVFPAGRSSLPK